MARTGRGWSTPSGSATTSPARGSRSPPSAAATGTGTPAGAARIPARWSSTTSSRQANRALAARLPHAQATFDAGGHTTDYWRTHAGAQMDWLAARAPRT
ncbi:MAG: hypothetical protein U0Q21_04145 [Dermatophilaceae bacterium]